MKLRRTIRKCSEIGKEDALAGMVKEGTIGLLGIAVLAFLMILGCWPSGERTAVGLAPQMEERRLQRGEVVTVKRYTVCMYTEDGLDEMSKWLGNDAEESARVFLKYGGEFVQAGTTVKILDPVVWFAKAKVRVAGTGRECYIFREFIE